MFSGGKSMRKVNTKTLPELSWSSPKGKFCGAGKEISEALGRNRLSLRARPTASTDQ
jgi:hypothetical protein